VHNIVTQLGKNLTQAEASQVASDVAHLSHLVNALLTAIADRDCAAVSTLLQHAPPDVDLNAPVRSGNGSLLWSPCCCWRSAQGIAVWSGSCCICIRSDAIRIAAPLPRFRFTSPLPLASTALCSTN
jgi:hypothetical protein